MLKIYTNPTSIIPPLVNYRGIGGISAGQEVIFPGFGSGVVTATGSKTSVITFGNMDGMPNTQGVRFSDKAMGFPFDSRQAVGRKKRKEKEKVSGLDMKH